MLARRFACPPVNEAAYAPGGIPNADPKELTGTVLMPAPRETFLSLLGEMVQMVNEAVRRRASTAKDASKPLSLEYMADRFDVDDPLRGYLAFTASEGWLQGFITATTFTTWNHGFRWDSRNPEMDLLHKHGDDDDKHGGAVTKAARKIDADGVLADELQSQLHAGDPDDAGIVYPTVAELSLLGALGCGRWLVERILEELEAEGSPYKYVVTQATDGSIAFYEKLGFVRVGALTAKKREVLTSPGGGEGASGDAASAGKKRKSMTPTVPKSKFVSSPHLVYKTETSEETIDGVAAKYNVDVKDLIFLNLSKHSKLVPGCTLRKEMKLLIPQLPTVEDVKKEMVATHQQFYEVPDDMPFKRIAEILNIDAKELQRMNGHMKGLQLISEVRAGTRLHTNIPELIFDEYCHWTFPDDNPALAEPSYMMARRLKPVSERTSTPSADSRIERSKPLMVDARPTVVPAGARAPFIEAIEAKKAAAAKLRQEWADSAWHVVTEDMPFKKCAEGLNIDPKLLRDLNNERIKGLQLSSFVKKDTWLQIKDAEELALLDKSGPPGVPEEEGAISAAAKNLPTMYLSNRVVQIDGEGDDYAYWYVLTYLPDLQWCHVAPLEKRGVFTEKPSPNGHVALDRDRWMLVREEEGGEIDVGAGRCHIMEAYEMMKTRANADTEEWDIVGRASAEWVLKYAMEAEPKKKGPKKVSADGEGGSGSKADGKCGASGGGGGKGSEKKSASKKQKKSMDGASPAPALGSVEKELKSFGSMLRLIKNHKKAAVFLDPVDPILLGIPDYFDVIKTPMDLSTVQSKLDSGKYASVLDAVADVNQIWANAFSYNPEGDPVRLWAESMKEFADRKLQPIVAACQARLSQPTPTMEVTPTPEVAAEPTPIAEPKPIVESSAGGASGTSSANADGNTPASAAGAGLIVPLSSMADLSGWEERMAEAPKKEENTNGDDDDVPLAQLIEKQVASASAAAAAVEEPAVEAPAVEAAAMDEA